MVRTNVTWAEQVGGTASTGTVPRIENMDQLGSGANAPVPRYGQFSLCNNTGYQLNQPSRAVSLKSRLPSTVPHPDYHPPKNKVNSKNTRYKTRVNKCRKTPTITRIIRCFLVDINAMAVITIQGKRTYKIIVVLLFFLSRVTLTHIMVEPVSMAAAAV